MIFALTVLFILSASIEGYVQSHYYALFPYEKKHRDLHPFYIVMRGVLILTMGYLTGIYYESLITGAVFAFDLACMFSFFHNGFYYLTRNKLDKHVYPKGFWDKSTTSDSWNPDVFTRTFLAIFGVVGNVLIYINN